MEKPKWLISPCEGCPRRDEDCACIYYKEWLVYAWDHVCAFLRKQLGVNKEGTDGK